MQGAICIKIRKHLEHDDWSSSLRANAWQSQKFFNTFEAHNYFSKTKIVFSENPFTQVVLTKDLTLGNKQRSSAKKEGGLMLGIIFILALISSSMVLYAVLSYTSNKRGYIFRIKKYFYTQEYVQKRESKDLKAGLRVIGNTVTKFSIFDGYKNKLQRELIKAHILLKAEEFITVSIISSLLTALLFSLVFKNILVGIPFLIPGWIFPGMFVKSKKKKRVCILNGQLADAIVLISNSLKAGYSFLQAVEMVSKEMPPPISEEFYQVQKEINLGYTTEQALENLISRVESDDLGLVITAVLIQRQAGGNLAEILDNISSTIRDRIKIKGEIRTLTAQGRISGVIISMVPVGLGLILQLTSPDYMGLLFENKIGWCILGLAVVMQLVGIYSINKIIKIEV